MKNTINSFSSETKAACLPPSSNYGACFCTYNLSFSDETTPSLLALQVMSPYRAETEVYSRAHISSSALHPASHSLVCLSKSLLVLHLCRGYPSLEFHRTYFSNKAGDSLGSRQSGHILSLWNCTEFIFCLQGHFFSTTNCSWIALDQTSIWLFVSNECFRFVVQDHRNKRTSSFSISPVSALQCRQT